MISSGFLGPAVAAPLNYFLKLNRLDDLKELGNSDALFTFKLPFAVGKYYEYTLLVGIVLQLTELFLLPALTAD